MNLDRLIYFLFFSLSFTPAASKVIDLFFFFFFFHYSLETQAALSPVYTNQYDTNTKVPYATSLDCFFLLQIDETNDEKEKCARHIIFVAFAKKKIYRFHKEHRDKNEEKKARCLKLFHHLLFFLYITGIFDFVDLSS